MMRLLFRALCLLVFPTLFAPFVALDPPSRLEALADALLDMGNINVHLLLHPRLPNTLHDNIFTISYETFHLRCIILVQCERF
jgi:hypothetical protein